MGEFAVGALGLAPLVEQGQDHLDLLRSQPMHPRPARGPVGKPSTCSAAGAAVRSPFGELEPVAGPSDRPAHLDGLGEQVEQELEVVDAGGCWRRGQLGPGLG